MKAGEMLYWKTVTGDIHISVCNISQPFLQKLDSWEIKLCE